jgi:CTP synthase
MQIAVIEYARNVLGWADANSTEFDEHTSHPVIHIMEYQKTVANKGGTMRLGSYPAHLAPNSLALAAYGQAEINERHRHRYEFNNAYRDELTKGGMVLSGISPNDELVEIIELPDHPWFLGVQFHPEFKSRPNRAHPLFRDFIGATVKASSILDKS